MLESIGSTSLTSPAHVPPAGRGQNATSTGPTPVQILRKLEAATLSALSVLCGDEAFPLINATVGESDSQRTEFASKLAKAARATLATAAGAEVVRTMSMSSRSDSSTKPASSSQRTPQTGEQDTTPLSESGKGASLKGKRPVDESSPLSEKAVSFREKPDADEEVLSAGSVGDDVADDLPPPIETKHDSFRSPAFASPSPWEAIENLVRAVTDAVVALQHTGGKGAGGGTAVRRPTVQFRAFTFGSSPTPSTPMNSTPMASQPVSRRVSKFGGSVTSMDKAAGVRSARAGSLLGVPSRTMMIITPKGSGGPSPTSAWPVPQPSRLRSDSVWSSTNMPPAQFTDAAIVGDEDFDGTSTLNQYVLLNSIGRGAQGEVFLAMDTEMNEFRAIKVVHRPAAAANVSPQAQGMAGAASPPAIALDSDDPPPPAPQQVVVANVRSRLDVSRNKVSQLQREIAAMKRCRHRNVVSLYEVIDDPAVDALYLVMQYVEQGPLVTMAKDGTPSKTVSPDKLARYARQLCAGLQYLHNHGIVHRDIKPDNILLGANEVVYLADFGVSHVFEESEGRSFRVSREEFGTRGTAVFFAPELLQDDGDDVAEDEAGSSPERRAQLNGHAVDVWALGVTFYLLLYGRLPWEHLNKRAACFDDILKQVIDFPSTVRVVADSHDTDSDDGNEAAFVERALDPSWLDVLRGMLDRDLAKRWPLTRVRDAMKQLADRAELQELQGSPFGSPGQSEPSTQLTALTQISDTSREALNRARRASAFDTAAAGSGMGGIPRGNPPQPQPPTEAPNSSRPTPPARFRQIDVSPHDDSEDVPSPVAM